MESGEEKEMTAHWTESNPQKFAYRIASDFIEQVRLAMKAKGWSQNKFAKKLQLTPGRVSQILNNPGNLTLETMVQWSRKLGFKTSVLLYDDGDSKNNRGPVNAEIFRLCWEYLRKPADMWEFKENKQAITKDKYNVFVSTVIKSRHGESQRGRIKTRFPIEYGYPGTKVAAGTTKEASLDALLSETKSQM